MYIIAAWIAFIWFFVLFCDTIFKTCMFHPYFKALHSTGLDVKPLMMFLRITRYNRFINQMGRFRSSLLKYWFDVGAVVTTIILSPCLVLFLVSLYQMYNSLTVEDYNNSVLMPVIPGYNFPSSHWAYYISVILLCSVFHEFGHALAASRERISIDNFGFALVAVVPLAFVNLRFEQFRQISKWQQMRIICAGIWHNIVLALFALLLYTFLSTALTPLYTVGKGITVFGIDQQSGLNHPAGFEIGDKIYGIGNCSINFKDDWNSCLREIAEKTQQGLCVPKNTDYKPIEACNNSSGHLHFQASKFDEILKEQAFQSVCLHARKAIQIFSECSQTSDCKVDSLCMFPVLSSEMHRFIVIKRIDKPLVLYVGTINELFTDVQVSRFVQKYKFLPVSYAVAIETFLEYIILFSCGLACLNVLPVPSLDGQFIIDRLVHVCLESIIPSYDHRRRIFEYISLFAVGILISFAVLTAYKFYVFGF